ncbi:MAG TPA: pepsin/retropepsin-like aspartic protease family protein [Saprospiraceae bacterium]|nr:pepsin/retropepsin-like aspartic protease family protein [Saprospiraceae bacterium]HMQ82465.1 pepsin/retropepsin-like aspartic protease family protein [Saprospiraceae bacterium]
MKGTTLLIFSCLLSVAALKAQKTTFQKIPFELVNGLVVVQASVNGDPGNFILNTGLPEIMLNSTKVSGLEWNSQARNGIPVHVNHFSWGGIERQQMDVIAMDMTHLETVSERPIWGIIGYELLQYYEVMFDSRNQVILLYTPKDSWVHELGKPLFSLNFKLYGQMPIINLQVEGQELVLGLDTGKSYSILRDQCKAKLAATSYKDLTQNAEDDSAPRIRIHQLESGDTAFEQVTFSLEDLKAQELGKVDGLLGMSFLMQYRFAINYKTKTVHFWKHGEEIPYRNI